MTQSFNELGLLPELLQAVAELGYSEPTPIQTETIPLLLAGKDVIGQAQTGTGKTAAYALPILQSLQSGNQPVQALVLAPTRELALQISDALSAYGRNRQARVLAVYGGQPYAPQIGRLKRGVDVVVGTPGRLIDLIEKDALDLSGVQTVILDEADEMLSMGFLEDIEKILTETPVERQTALFSATLPPAIRRLAERYMREPQSIEIKSRELTVAAIDQRYILVNASEKLAVLTRLYEVEPITRALIFVRTRLASGELAAELAARGYPAEVLNGDLTQEARERVVSRFRQNQIKVLVATDVAARGLDIDDISHVINFDLPDDIEVYVHRVGRTGRAGKTGIAITLATPAEQWRLRRIEAFTRQKMTAMPIPSIEEILAQREGALLQQMNVWLTRARYRRERELVAALVEAGHDPLEIAAAALKIARADEKQRPIAEVSEVVEKRPRTSERDIHAGSPSSTRRSSKESTIVSHEPGMVRLQLSKGKAHGIRPNDVVSAIAYHAQIPGSIIGKIHIQDDHTLVDVPEKFVAQVLAKAGTCRIHKQPINLALATAA